MPTLNDILQRTADLDAADKEWLHLLVGDWQLLSDLAFADLVLWLRPAGAPEPLPDGTIPPGEWVAATHVRPNTGPLVFFDDLVGTHASSTRAGLLDQCAQEQHIIRDHAAEWQHERPVREEAIPVLRAGRLLAVMTRHRNLATMRTPSRLELVYRETADMLARMVASGDFPTLGAPTGQRRGAPRVGDGIVRLDAEGVVTFASPNATSGLHRIGHHGEVVGEYLGRVITEAMHQKDPVDESLALVVTGRAPWRSEVDSGGASLTLRAIPLVERGQRVGAVVLLRDVSELRRRERELLTKDATIREIHHRVKNNLQTVAALLRLQSRRVTDEMAVAALAEAGRRVATIALVHDTLSRTLDESVDFDEIVKRAMSAVVEVANGERVRWSLEGSFGHLAAEDATALAMIVTELVQNAIEHGVGERGGAVVVSAQRGGQDGSELVVEILDDGVGLPEGFRPGRSGLGTQIVSAFVQDLRGSITWLPREPVGTAVRMTARLRHA